MIPVMLLIHLILIPFLSLVLSTPNSIHINHTLNKSPEINLLFFSDSGIDLNQISEGRVGEGWLLYYLPGHDYGNPSLVVYLLKQTTSSPAIAELYGSPPGLNYVPVRIEANEVTFEKSIKPTITITAPDGWWQKNGVINYNLEVQIYGPIYAMWGGGYDQKFGPQGWTALIEPGELGVQIRIGDINRDGIPDWELRSLLAKLSGRGDFRSNYAERKCDSPIELDLGVSPLWPFVAFDGSYEQLPGRLRPPIVVDWQAGKITHFSELVTVRNQNCSYSFYTIEPLEIGELNRVNFEAPLASYDLSGQGIGYPNLILRAEHYPAGDRWFNQSRRDFETIRYSWRNAIGDSRWDYKIEVAGFYPYEFKTPIAGGLLIVDAPSYEHLPLWVIERQWPMVTFVDTQGSLGHSSEGIYAWSPRELGDSYLRGEVDIPNPDAFSEIRQGWRGEFRYSKNLRLKLYISPIDNNLHLLGADAGILRLENDLILRESNLDNGQYIDSWKREKFIGDVNEEPYNSTHWEIQEAIFAVDDYLIYTGGGKVEILPASYPPASLEINPPTDNSTWLSFQDQVESITVHKKDPYNLASWLGEFPGDSFSISGASISELQKFQNGFQFKLELQPDYQTTSRNELLSVKDLGAGTYLVRHEGTFSLYPITPAGLSIDIDYPRGGLSIGNPGLLNLVLENHGLETVPRLILIVTAQAGDQLMEIIRQPVDVLGGELQQIHFSWQPFKAGTWQLNARLEDKDGRILASQRQEFEIQPREVLGREVLLVSSKLPSQVYLVGLILFTCVIMISALAGFVQRK
jgi:hypothetical protein